MMMEEQRHLNLFELIILWITYCITYSHFVIHMPYGSTWVMGFWVGVGALLYLLGYVFLSFLKYEESAVALGFMCCISFTGLFTFMLYEISVVLFIIAFNGWMTQINLLLLNYFQLARTAGLEGD